MNLHMLVFSKKGTMLTISITTPYSEKAEFVCQLTPKLVQSLPYKMMKLLGVFRQSNDEKLYALIIKEVKNNGTDKRGHSFAA